MKINKLSLLIFLCLSIFIIFLSGCNKKVEEPEIYPEDVSQLVEDFLSLYQSKDPSAGQLLSNMYDQDMRFDGFQGILASQLTFEITGVKENDTGYTVSTKIQNVDFKKAFQKVETSLTDQYEESTITEEMVLSMLEDTLTSPNADLREFDVDIYVQMYLDGYKVVLSPSLSNALLGGANEYFSELTGGIQHEESN